MNEWPSTKNTKKSGYEECWFGNVKREEESIGIEVNERAVLGKMKSQWKKQVKKKVRKAFEAELETKKQQERKLRFLRKKGSETYLKEIHNDDARQAVKIRLNMIEWIERNYGRVGDCPLCGEEDSTEHVFASEAGGNESGVSVKDLENELKMDKIVELFKNTEIVRKEKILENLEINIEMLTREEAAENSGE